MAMQMTHHHTAEFRAIFAELAERLECLFETVCPIPCITGSGMTVFEAAQMSFGAVGSKVVAQAIRFSLTKQSKS